MKLNWGVIGCGGIAYRRTMPGMLLAENCNLVAVMDADMAVANKVMTEFGAAYAFDSVDELLSINSIDAVYIASPVFCHKEQVIKAAKAGKHILLEKPMGLTVKESVELEQLCADCGVKLGVGLMMRFNRLHKQVHDLIANGKLGEIVSMRAQFTCWYPEMQGAWRQDRRCSGGGALMDMGIHCIDLLRYLSGLEASEVIALTGNQIFNYEVEDAASVVMRMNNGALAYVDAAFNIPDDAAVSKLEIYGTCGSITLQGSLAQDETGEGVLIFTDSDKGYDAQQNRTRSESSILRAEDGNLYTKEVSAFSDAVINDTAVPVTAADAICVQAIVEAAYKSAESRCAVELL